MPDDPHNLLRQLPGVDAVLDEGPIRTLVKSEGRPRVVGWIRDEIAVLRSRLRDAQHHGPPDGLLNEVVAAVTTRGREQQSCLLDRVINATGVVLHTGLGRAVLSAGALRAVGELSGAGNVEVDLLSGERRYRGYQLQPLWHALTGCDDSLIVNNNAAATLLALQSLCAGREVIISRGQLIEIGGSFRLPEIFELSGAKLREVGTTNHTRLSDYENAVNENTVAIMRVHPSNYRLVGFEKSVEIDSLAKLAHAHGLLAIDHIGSGCLVDTTVYGLPQEPTFQDSVAAGADLVLGSGDKLLGGPQTGILLSRGLALDAARRHPLARAVRVDKLTLAALQATLQAYLRGTAQHEIPVLCMLNQAVEAQQRRAQGIVDAMGSTETLHLQIDRQTAPVGGGSLPGAEQPTVVICCRHTLLNADDCARQLRMTPPRVLCRIRADAVTIDLRSVPLSDDSFIVAALSRLAETA